ncbi:hypothetical protein [Pyxidicoccus xibeiensis]|uniref:hypothetical protein n=1 Tax=Pyxidicoccus xibeiensis TaxID=2906759 RepID=UPI0020A827E6|nr:hypothetical protein [Pyxidicoccus xibeiensis]MCP3140658.1 hypothetical protein [Pyxidicoccus xibeiensis]
MPEPSSRKKVPRWLTGTALATILLSGWVFLQARRAVVTVHFMPEQDVVLAPLYVIVGGEKQHAPELRRGQSDRFRFQPDPEFPLDLAFWIGPYNGGWTGPHLRARQRLDVTIDGEGSVTWTECDWPCW